MTESSAPRDILLHIADLHFWHVLRNPLRMLNKRFLGNLNVALRRRREFPMQHAEPFADALASLNICDVLLTGDFTSTALDEEFLLARRFVLGLRRRNLEVSVTPGNHDLYTFESRRKGRFEQYLGEFLPADGYPARHDLPGGTPLILLQTARPNLLSSAGHIAEQDVTALAILLEGMRSTVVVAGHYPLLDHTREYRLPPSRRLRNGHILREALGRSGRRILYVSGHVHRTSCTRDPLFANVEHLCTDAFFRRAHRGGFRGEFCEINIHEDGFRVFRHTFAADTDGRLNPGKPVRQPLPLA